MKIEYKKIIKNIKKLKEGDCISYLNYEILCLVPKKTFIIIYNMTMKEVSFNELINFIDD